MANGQHENLIELVDSLKVQDRAKAREDYRELICVAQNAAESSEAAFVDIDVINKGITETNRVFKSGKVLLPTEGTYDAEALKHYSELFRQKVLSQKDEALQFNSGEYATQLVSQIKALSSDGRNREEDEFPTSSQWAEFGRTVGTFLRRAPAFHYLYGSFTRDDAATQGTQTQTGRSQAGPSSSQNAATRRKEKAIVLKNENAPLSQPKTLTTASEVAENEETTKMVDLVWERLKTIFIKNGRMPLSYFEFVLDPDCFVQSMENMFYVSFLVKDGRAGIQLDEAGLPVLTVYEDAVDSAGTSNRRNAADCKQCVITMNRDTWEALVQAYNVKVAVLNFKG